MSDPSGQVRILLDKLNSSIYVRAMYLFVFAHFKYFSMKCTPTVCLTTYLQSSKEINSNVGEKYRYTVDSCREDFKSLGV